MKLLNSSSEASTLTDHTVPAPRRSAPRLSILALSLLAATTIAVAAPETDREVEARKAALDLAGAFSNDGFKMRDGHWCGTVKPREHALIAVNLYAGNQYWFSAGATAPAKKLAVTVYEDPPIMRCLMTPLSK